MNALAMRREKANLLQSEVATKLNIDRSTVAKWETGNNMPRSDKLPLLAKMYGCTIDQLFCIEDEEAVHCG